MQRHRKEYALGRVVTVRAPGRLGAGAPSVAASRWAVALGVLVVWVLLGALPAARADNLCKPAAPLPQSKCVKDAQCCAGLVCALSGGDNRCQPGCHIGGAFYASGVSNPTNACQSCQPSVSTTAFASIPNGTACSDGNACTRTDTCEAGVCVGDPKPDGTTCDDGSAATLTDICTTGTCGPCVPSTTASPRFVDNGDGTITDRGTCLVWEKKNDAGGGTNLANPHDVDNNYTWTSTFGGTAADGTAFTDFLVRLNNRCAGDVSRDCSMGGDTTCAGIGSGKCGFAGHRDWGLPSVGRDGGVAELESIVNCTFFPCIDPIFGPTAASDYWSSTSRAVSPFDAWLVDFGDGFVNFGDKLIARRVRAGRGGP